MINENKSKYWNQINEIISIENELCLSVIHWGQSDSTIVYIK